MSDSELARIARLTAYAREQAERAVLARVARDEAIARAVDELGYSQRQVAHASGLAKSGVCRIVNDAPFEDVV